MIQLPQEIKIAKKERNKAIFEIPGLYPGYGITIGNALRRVLLSSLEGAAIVQVRIKGVPHEFSTINGIAEDVLTIMLNLKRVRFKMYGDEAQVATLKKKGEGQVRAADFKLPSQIEIINNEQLIATITNKNTELEMEVLVEKGVGYEPVERRKKEKLPIGAIALDAIYTPTKRVTFRIENMRVGERTDFDRLFVEVETDGTRIPEEAFLNACQILIKHFSLIAEPLEREITKEKAKKEAMPSKTDLTSIKVEDLKLSSRIQTVLIENKVKTLAGIVKKSEESLLGLKGMGEKGLKEIKRLLKKFNLELKK